MAPRRRGSAATRIPRPICRTQAPPDLGADPADLAPPRKPVDLASTDLAGYVNCFGVAVCDPTMAFCIKFHTGSQAAPGNVPSGSPACYAPADCNGTNMNCDCITQDAALGGNCQSWRRSSGRHLRLLRHAVANRARRIASLDAPC